MKATTKEQRTLKRSSALVNPALDAKYAGKVLFPEKLEQAKAFIAEKGLPKGWKIKE